MSSSRVCRSLSRVTLSRAASELAGRDRDLRRLLERHGPPPLWARRPGFATLVRIILEQQISLLAARAAYRRLEDGLGSITPSSFIAAGADGLRSLGQTRQKAAYCVGLARAIAKGDLDLAAVARMDDEDAATALTSVRGVGPWTASIYLLMALRRPDVWPDGDLALIAALREVKGPRANGSPQAVARTVERWRPYRSVAARMLWQHYLAREA